MVDDWGTGKSGRGEHHFHTGHLRRKRASEGKRGKDNIRRNATPGLNLGD